MKNGESPTTDYQLKKLLEMVLAIIEKSKDKEEAIQAVKKLLDE